MENELLTDNGEEFNNELVRKKSNHSNILIKCTAAQSPKSNDIMERDNVVLPNKMSKLLLHKSYGFEQ